MTEPDGYRKPVEESANHSYWWLPGTATPDKEDGWERLYTPDTIIEVGSRIEKEIQEEEIENRYAYFKKRLLEELSEDKAEGDRRIELEDKFKGMNGREIIEELRRKRREKLSGDKAGQTDEVK